MLQARETSPHFAEIERLRTTRTQLYEGLGATVLLEDSVEEWAKSVLQNVLPR
jgi:hypothetical protein